MVKRTTGPRVAMISAAIVAVALILGLAAWSWVNVPNLFPLPPSSGDPAVAATREATRSQAIVTTRASVLAALAGLGALITIGINYRNSHTTNQTFRITERGHLTDRYTKAIEQLGNSDTSPTTRLGGIYALQQVATESDQLADQIMAIEVLSAFVRTSRPKRNLASDEVDVKNPHPRFDENASGRDPVDLKPDILAAITVLGQFPQHLSRRADFTQVDLSYVRLPGVTLRSALLRDADLSGTDLTLADLRHADLRGANLRHADLRDADLSGANLHNADLTNADVSRGILNDADLRLADLTLSVLHNAGLRNADLGRAVLRDADLREADLREAIVARAILQGANLDGAVLVRAYLAHVDLRRTLLRDANFRDADLRGSDLAGARIYGTNFARTNLFRANLEGSDITGASFDGALLYGAQLSQEQRNIIGFRDSVHEDGSDD